MGKSVNEYYAEKMKKLLEMQKSEKHPQIPAPEKRADTAPRVKKPAVNGDKNVGRNYYEIFRKDSVHEKKQNYDPPKATGNVNAKRSAEYNPPPRGPKKKTPEQTEADRRREEEQKRDADLRAKRGKTLRRVRDAIISACLIMAVAAVLLVVVYRLLFVVKTVNVKGNDKYSADDIISASGIIEGEHLYSFRNSVAENGIILRCPAVGAVEVDKVAPATVNLNVTEEEILFYADFFGELRQISDSLRILYATNEAEAAEAGLVRLYLPPVTEALSGQKAVYSGIRNDTYIYELADDLKESALWDGVVSIDMRNKYNLSLNYNNRFLITLGDTQSLKTKLKLAAEITKDEMFEKKDDKARINVSDLSASSVIIDNKLVLK